MGYLEDYAASVAKNRTDSLSNLKEMKAKHNLTGKMEVPYSGSGDSGMVDGCDIEYDSDLPDELLDAVARAADAILEDQYPGWEINEGAEGKFTFNFDDDTIELEHGTYHVEYESSDFTFEKASEETDG